MTRLPRAPLLSAIASLGLTACANLVSWEPQAPAQPERQVRNQPVPRQVDPLPQRPYGPNDHLVKAGDTVYSIAFRNQIDYRDLARWNNIGPDYLIYPGQVLHLNATSPLTPRNGQIAAQGIEISETAKPRPLLTAPTPIKMGTPAPAAPVEAAPEIGRASCRERVS
jgi:lipoprotein NlpD